MLKLLRLTGLALMLTLPGGCVSRRAVVINSNADIVRLGSDVRGHIYVRNAAGVWELTANAVLLPEGWFAGAYHP